MNSSQNTVHVGLSINAQNTVVAYLPPTGEMRTVQLPTVLGYANERWYVGEEAFQMCERPLHLLAASTGSLTAYGEQCTPISDCFAIYLEQVLQYAYRAGIGGVSYEGFYRITTQIGAISVPPTLPQATRQILLDACKARNLGFPRLFPSGTMMALQYCSRPQTPEGFYLFCHQDPTGCEITLAEYSDSLLETCSSGFITDMSDLIEAVQGVLNDKPSDAPLHHVIVSDANNTIRWRLAAMLGQDPLVMDNASVLMAEGASIENAILRKDSRFSGFLVLDALRAAFEVQNEAGQCLLALKRDTTIPVIKRTDFQADDSNAILYLMERNQCVQKYQVPFTGAGVITLNVGADGFVHCSITKD